MDFLHSLYPQSTQAAVQPSSPNSSNGSGSNDKSPDIDWPTLDTSTYDSYPREVRELKGRIDQAVEEISDINDGVQNPGYEEEGIAYRSGPEIQTFINDISNKALNALNAAREFSHGLGVIVSTNNGELITLEQKYDRLLLREEHLKQELQKRDEMIRTIATLVIPILIVIGALALAGFGWVIAVKIGGELSFFLKAASLVLIPSSFHIASQIPSYLEFDPIEE